MKFKFLCGSKTFLISFMSLYSKSVRVSCSWSFKGFVLFWNSKITCCHPHFWMVINCIIMACPTAGGSNFVSFSLS